MLGPLTFISVSFIKYKLRASINKHFLLIEITYNYPSKS